MAVGTLQKSQLRPVVELVEVMMAMRECAFPRHRPGGQGPPGRALWSGSGSGPQQWARDRPVNYMSQFLAANSFVLFTTGPDQDLVIFKGSGW